MDTAVLPSDHPGFSDAAYRDRRAAIAGISASWSAGLQIPHIEYTPAEHRVWATVSAELAPRHRELCCSEFLAGKEALGLPTDEIPQLDEVSRRLARLAGFHLEPVPGLVPTRTFYGSLASRSFMSTQYVRHGSVPLYTPEPDVIHEVLGHGNMLANKTFADLHEAAGTASLRCVTDEALEFFSRVFWFTLEFGVVFEDGVPKAYGAGLASSFGELGVFQDAALLPFEPAVAGRTDYDISTYQPLLFTVGSIPEMSDRLGAFFEGFDDETYLRMSEAA